MSSPANAIAIQDSSDDERPTPPPASSPANAIVIHDSSDDEGPKSRRVIAAPKPKPNLFSFIGGAKPTAKAKAPPPPFPSWSTAAPPAAAPPPPSKKLCGLDRQAVAVASVPSPPLVTSTTEHCTVLKCTAGSCLRLHQCDGKNGKGRGCQGRWLASVAFDFKKGGSKRNRTCKECAARQKERNAINNPINNPINNAKTSKKMSQRAIAYELETQGDQHDLSDAALRARGEAAINTASELIADYWKTYPNGFAVTFYGASTGSDGYSVVEEGVKQFTYRGYTPPIIDASGRAPDVALTGAWGQGGVSVCDCGSSKVISRAVETALHTHFAPICDASDDKMPRLWRKCGAGAPQGIGPYHVCIRIMPLPLPHGWRRSF